MAERKNFNTPKAPRMSLAFPQAVLAEKFVFISGTPGLDLTTGNAVESYALNALDYLMKPITF